MTEKQKAPTPVTAGSEGQGNAKHCPQHLTIGPRHRRLLAALERRTAVTREQADRIAHASNSPHYVGELRKRYGIQIHTLMASGIDYDGHKIQYGVYWLDGDGKTAVRKLLREAS